MEIVVRHAAEELDPTAWAALNPAPRQTRAWFMASERYFHATQHVYIVARDQSGPRAILPLYDRFDPAFFNVTECYYTLVRRALMKMNYLCVGSPLGFEADLIGDPSLEADLLAAAVDFAHARGVDFIAANFRRAPLPAWNAYRIGRVFDAHMLAAPGQSHDDFLGAFSAKKRHHMRSEIREAAPLFQAPLRGNEARFLRLRALSCERQGSHNRLEASFFTELALACGDQLTLIVAGTEQDWMGASLLLSNPTEYCALSVGVKNRDHNYFSLLIHEPLRLAYQTGRKQIDLGAACDEAKRRRGAVATPLYFRPISKRCLLLMKGTQPLINVSNRIKSVCQACAALTE